MAHVLIVDDNRDLCRMMARLLSSLGHDAACALGGDAALARLDTHLLPDLMILDVMMPGMDGLEVLGRVRHDPRTAAVPVVMLSAADDAKTVAAARALGAADFWSKGTIDYARIADGLARHLPPATGGTH